MKCPTCGTELRSRKLDFFTSLVPRESLNCDACDRVLLIFPVVGEEDLLVWLDERSPGMSFEGFVADALFIRHLENSENS